ncbi:MAG TPA: hypothetical protein VIT23_13945 [Terrimicrobiaceae bacterium]
MKWNKAISIAVAAVVSIALQGCEAARTAAYAGGGAAAAGALGAGIGYIASKGNIQTTAIAGGVSAVGGALLGGAYAGAQKRAKEKQKEEGYQLGASDTVKRQYWIARNLQKRNGDAEPGYRTQYYTFNIQPDPTAEINRVPYNITVPILEN